VGDFVKAFNLDGRDFIRSSASALLETDHKVEVRPKTLRRSLGKALPGPKSTIMHQPKTFQHYVMNLPASAITFLDAFIGLYAGKEQAFEAHRDMKLPMVHMHCFSTKSEDNKREEEEICKEISQRIGYEIKPGDEDVSIWDVRDVAPKKRMFCASFRLPPEVVFRQRA